MSLRPQISLILPASSKNIEACTELRQGTECSGRRFPKHEARSSAGYPVVGIVLMPLQSGEVRHQPHAGTQTSLSRKAAGAAHIEQMVAANVDIAFAVFSLKEEMNLNRLERYLTLIKERGIEPVVLLTKADLCAPEDTEAQKRAVTSVAPDVQVHSLCSKTQEGVSIVAHCLGGYRTGVLLGSSGAGKSTLINALVGTELQRVNTVRENDERGRHHHSAPLGDLANGGMIIDTPGVRELQFGRRAPPMRWRLMILKS